MSSFFAFKVNSRESSKFVTLLLTTKEILLGEEHINDIVPSCLVHSTFNSAITMDDRALPLPNTP
jgi:hypothetical protein